MANYLRIYQDASLIADFLASPYQLLDFSGNAPTAHKEEYASALDDGSRILYSRYDNVVDTIHFLIYGATQQAVNDSAETLERAIEEANLRLDGTGAVMLLKFQPEGTDVVYESKILQVVWLTNADRMVQSAGKMYAVGIVANYFIEASIIVERTFYWEGPLVEIPLTNGNGNNVTGGITVYTHDDAGSGHDNWVDIAGADVKGSLPAPLYIELRNNRATTPRMGAVRFARNARFTPSSFQHVYEIENGQRYAGGSLVTDSDYSGAASNNGVSWNVNNGTTPFKLVDFPITSAQLGYARNRWFRAILEIPLLGSQAANIWYKIKVSLYRLTTLVETDWVLPPLSGLNDVGAIRLPSYDIAELTSDGCYIEIWAKNVTGGNVNSTLDYIEFLPTERLDGYVYMNASGYYIEENGGKIIQDGPRNIFYIYNLSGGLTAHYVASGQTIMGDPGKAQRVFFAWDSTNGWSSGMMAWTGTVIIKYRERRLRI